MITFNLKSFNSDIKDYNNFVVNLEIKNVICPNCGTCDIERHGYYKRYVIISGNKYYIRVLRVRCKRCGHTHAVLPNFIIPYLHDPIENILQLVTSSIKDIDEGDIKLITKIKKKWIPILKSLGLTFKTKLEELFFCASKSIKQCIFQIHRGKYFIMS